MASEILEKHPGSRAGSTFHGRDRCGDRCGPESPARIPIATGRMIRVVRDTNIIVPALLQPLGPVRTGVPVRAQRLNRLCVSGNIYAEYEEVISRPRLQRPDDVITSTLQAIREKGFWVRPMETVRACSDPDDDIFWSALKRSSRSSGLSGDGEPQALSRI